MTPIHIPRSELVIFGYTNHRGEHAIRLVRPIIISHTSNEYHPEQQWILHAFDVDKNALRTFAMRHIIGWRPA